MPTFNFLGKIDFYDKLQGKVSIFVENTGKL